jgi:hypothetical protein
LTSDLGANTTVSIVGVLCDAADANLQLAFAKPGAASTKLDLGGNFAKTTANQFYEIWLQCDPNSAVVNYKATNLTSGSTSSGTLSGSQMPTATTMFYNHGIAVASTGVSATFAEGGYYIDAPPY